MSWKYLELTETLSGLYYRSADISALLIRAGFAPEKFVLDGAANTIWTLALKKIEQLSRLRDLLASALEDYPRNPILQSYFEKDSTLLRGVYAGEKPSWKGKMSRGEYEVLIGEQSTLLPISFLQAGLLKAAPVARLVTPFGLATGFLISEGDLLLTNQHVISSHPENGRYKAQFNYETSLEGLPLAFEEFDIDDTLYLSSIADDWAIVHVSGRPSVKYGFLPLREMGPKKNDFVNIIQHPGGEYKKIALYHNVITYYDQRVVQYLTDTLPGSSGSPVFNSEWEVVALHHSGGWFNEPDNPRAVLRNEGININRILEATGQLLTL
ncbi:MAG TPA: trypsin-like peptidase domain-containing protein [Puia sp.]|nr:trypsin-like peptidase domain-containing protein [Puia sp.]